MRCLQMALVAIEVAKVRDIPAIPMAPCSADLGGIVGKPRSAIAPVHIQDMPRHPGAFVGRKIEGRVCYSIDGAVTPGWNALKIATLSRWPVSADASFDWPRSDRIDHDPLS